MPTLIRAAVTVLAATASFAATGAVPHAELPRAHRGFVTSHCGKCHSAKDPEAGFNVDDLPLTLDSVETAARWQKVLNALNSGEMPPADEPQPTPDAKAEFLDTLSTTLVVARKALSDQGGQIAMRRLNRREYQNTIHDLLGVDAEADDLPADTSTLSFDTVGANLFMSASQFEQYESIGREALSLMLARLAAADATPKKRFECEETLPRFVRNLAGYREQQRQATRWFAALDKAIASPENADVVAEIKRADPAAKMPYFWDRLAGMPPPEAFGFEGPPKFNPGSLRRMLNETEREAYVNLYFTMPKIESGAYLMLSAPIHNKMMMDIPGEWPPGEYVFRVRCAALPEAAADRKFIELTRRAGGDRRPALSAHHVTGTLENPQVIEIPYTLSAQEGDMSKRQFLFREIGTGGYEGEKAIFEEGVKRNGAGPEYVIWIDWIELERKPDAKEKLTPAVRALLPVLEASSEGIDAVVLRQALERFVVEAYRGMPPAAGEIDRLAAMFEANIAAGADRAEALRETLVSVLSSPRFLYRAEPGGDNGRRRLDGLELATRLSYFLWGGPPDARLRELAAAGTLLEPAVLEAETNRLLDDPRSAGFVEPFLFQWLTLERLDLFKSSLALYPKFDDSTRSSARREVYETFAQLLRDGGPITDLLAADYVVVDALLADYYGLEGVTGDEFRRVALPAGSPRGGLLGMAAVHAMGSDGEHSNPVERGAWVLRKLLDDPPPPAPPNVPQLSRLAGQSLTTRERVRLHQEAPQCANCHRKIDPIGFGLENFDAVGQWRTTDSYVPLDENSNPIGGERKQWTIDPSGTLYGGPSFKDFFELRGIIASRGDRFARGFTAALVEYALGRPCGFSDAPLVDGIVARAADDQLALRSFIHALVQSDAFRTK